MGVELKKIETPEKCIICKEDLVKLNVDKKGKKFFKKIKDNTDDSNVNLIRVEIFCPICKIKYMDLT